MKATIRSRTNLSTHASADGRRYPLNREIEIGEDVANKLRAIPGISVYPAAEPDTEQEPTPPRTTGRGKADNDDSSEGQS